MNAKSLFAALLAVASVPSALATECKSVRADVVEVATTEGCTLASSCFIGQFDGDHGFSGATEFALDGSNAGPASSSDFISYSGPFVYATSKGRLTMRESGVYNPGTGQPQSGAVAGYQQIVGGTGEFAGASGYLYSGGRASNGVFRTQVNGKICLP